MLGVDIIKKGGSLNAVETPDHGEVDSILSIRSAPSGGSAMLRQKKVVLVRRRGLMIEGSWDETKTKMPMVRR